MDLYDISETVQNARKARGLTQQQLADTSGLSRNRLNRFEAGQVSDMNFGTVLALLNALDLDLRIGPYNAGRPTIEDITRENDPEF